MVAQLAGEGQYGKMVRQMNRMVDQLQKGFFSFCPAESWTPAVNLYETDSTYLVCVDLAGVEKDKLDLAVTNNQLRLRGQRAVPSPCDRDPATSADPPPMRVHLMEIDHGPFTREVDLPNDVDVTRISATYRNGMLWVELPKK